MFPVKEECPGESSSWQEVAPPLPRPMEGLNEMGPPPFLTKTFDMVDDSSSDCIVSWSRGGHSFVVWDPHAFSTSVLPRYFKHNNFSSFGFRKIDANKWEFANESFLQGQKHLLKQIRRRKTNLPPPSPPNQGVDALVEVGRFGPDVEIDTLRRDKQVLVTELVRLRQQQQTTRAYLQQMEVRLQSTEKKQQQMMSFLARAMQNPKFVHQLVQHKENNKEIEEAMSKKRQRPIEGGESSRVKVESDESTRLYGYHVSELEALAMEMQGFGRAEEMEMGNERELDDGFWEELLSEEFEEREDGGEDVSGLADRLGGFLGE